jgi:hypothetical protein
MRRVYFCAAFTALALAKAAAQTPAPAQSRDILITGGWMFPATSDARVQNPGILIRGAKLLRIGGDLSIAGPVVDTIRLTGAETVIPGMFDLHAHYATEFFPGGGRTDDTAAYPALFLANGVTSTFPAGEMQPEAMRALRIRVENGQQAGPRIYNAGPYYGTARPGWAQASSPAQIIADMDKWFELGARAIKVKGIAPDALRVVIERAHLHGLTVTGHLDSGSGRSVNPRDAILMGIDRIEHFMGGDAYPATRSAYTSLENFTTFDTPEYKRTFELYKTHRVYYDATLSAYGYYGKRDPEVFAYFTEEKRFLTPYMRAIIDARPPRTVNEQFEKIYWVKRKEIKAFYDAGGGDLITLGTDHPSWGEWFSPFSVHRELHSFVLSGIPAGAALRFATINPARALGVGDRLGSIETGKWADLVILRGDPIADIRRTREARIVIRGGVVYDPAALMKSVEGKLGPKNDAEAVAWGKR